MAGTTTITLSNWWCPECEQFVAADDMTGRQHNECRTMCEWLRTPLVFSMEHDDGEEQKENPNALAGA